MEIFTSQPRLFKDEDMWIAAPPGFSDLATDMYATGSTPEAAIADLLKDEEWQHLKPEDFVVGTFCKMCKLWVQEGESHECMPAAEAV